MKDVEIEIDDAFEYSIGYKSYWMIAKSIESQKIVEFLKEIELRKQGIMLKHINWKVYVLKPFQGWTFIIGEVYAGSSSKQSVDDIQYILKKLSQQIGEVQFFVSDRSVDLYGWSKAIDGNIIQLYINGQSGTYSIGMLPVEEQVIIGKCIDEESIIRLAEAWSINPLLIPDNKWNNLYKDSLCVVRKKSCNSNKCLKIFQIYKTR